MNSESKQNAPFNNIEFVQRHIQVLKSDRKLIKENEFVVDAIGYFGMSGKSGKILGHGAEKTVKVIKKALLKRANRTIKEFEIRLALLQEQSAI